MFDERLLDLLKELWLAGAPVPHHRRYVVAVAEGAPVEETGLQDALLVLPIEGIIDVHVAMAQTLVVVEGAHPIVDLPLVLADVHNLLTKLVQKLPVGNLFREELGCHVERKVATHRRQAGDLRHVHGVHSLEVVLGALIHGLHGDALLLGTDDRLVEIREDPAECELVAQHVRVIRGREARVARGHGKIVVAALLRELRVLVLVGGRPKLERLELVLGPLGVLQPLADEDAVGGLAADVAEIALGDLERHRGREDAVEHDLGLVAMPDARDLVPLVGGMVRVRDLHKELLVQVRVGPGVLNLQ
mmetsp:Transcript_33088/g.102717  ORF Transcript_33088/g.102717 Transcript_33088/m.102717 type:complete len:304 (+) Transcript_33088:397-1308(+)